MARKLALKRLTASDLTVFRWHFVNRPAGNQKAVNLDSQVLTGEFYLELGKGTALPNPKYKVELKLSGPGGAAPHTLMRKVLKQQKNWRLNGEFIDSPVDAPERYNVLAVGDFALMEFQGEHEPESINMILISAVDAQDAALHGELFNSFPVGSMRVVTETFIRDHIERAGLGASHSLSEWLDGGLLEGAALGSSTAVSLINSRRRGRGLSPEEFLAARKRAETVGISGEVLLNDWFLEKQQIGQIAELEWTSSINAIAPYDFQMMLRSEGLIRRVDAKTTSGSFENAIHMSRAELREAVAGGFPYDIYRIYQMDQIPEMRIAYDIGPAVAEVLRHIEGLPIGVTVDSVSIDPALLPFSSEIFVIATPDSEAEPEI